MRWGLDSQKADWHQRNSEKNSFNDSLLAMSSDVKENFDFRCELIVIILNKFVMTANWNIQNRKMVDNFLRLLSYITWEVNSCRLTCVSDKLMVLASSFRSAPTTYWFFSNACSNFSSWLGLKAVRILFGFRNGSKNSGKWGPRIIRRNIIYYIGNSNKKVVFIYVLRWLINQQQQPGRHSSSPFFPTKPIL